MPDGPANLDHLPDDPALLKGLVRELLATPADQLVTLLPTATAE